MNSWVLIEHSFREAVDLVRFIKHKHFFIL
jgi:hypothetical protein